jgi:hypothetical protein
MRRMRSPLPTCRRSPSRKSRAQEAEAWLLGIADPAHFEATEKEFRSQLEGTALDLAVVEELLSQLDLNTPKSVADDLLTKIQKKIIGWLNYSRRAQSCTAPIMW